MLVHQLGNLRQMVYSKISTLLLAKSLFFFTAIFFCSVGLLTCCLCSFSSLQKIKECSKANLALVYRSTSMPRVNIIIKKKKKIGNPVCMILSLILIQLVFTQNSSVHIRHDVSPLLADLICNLSWLFKIRDEHVMLQNRHSESLFSKSTGIGNSYKDTTVHLNRTLCVLTDSI